MPEPFVAATTLDFALLQRSVSRHAGRNRVALLSLLGLLVLLLGSVAVLLLYLNQFEDDEAARRRAADAQWLEQSVQFHFRRLEDDLLVLARQTMLQPNTDGAKNRSALVVEPVVQGGVLWRAPGVILSSGWIAADQLGDPHAGPARWHLDRAAHPDNAQALAIMQSTTQGLRRTAYAGLEPIRK